MENNPEITEDILTRYYASTISLYEQADNGYIADEPVGSTNEEEAHYDAINRRNTLRNRNRRPDLGGVNPD